MDYISITEFGAIGDGVTDNTIAIQQALNYAWAFGLNVYVPEGVFAHSSTLTIVGISIFGAGNASILRAIGDVEQAIYLKGDGASLTNLSLDSNAMTRGSTGPEAKIAVWDATHFKISDVTILNSKSAGILVYNSSNGLIENNSINGTNSDGIHITNGSFDIRIENNDVRNAGDDSIAVVSYAYDSAITHDIEIVNNRVYDNEWGRGLSVVGGESIKILNNLVDTNKAGWAGIYIGTEESHNTLGVKDILVQGNIVLNTGTEGNHGSITIYKGPTGFTIEDVQLIGNKVTPAPGANVVEYRYPSGEVPDVLQEDNGQVEPQTFKILPYAWLVIEDLYLYGDAADNMLTGLQGDDTLVGGLGQDRLDGAEGRDTASYTNASTGVVADLKVSGSNTGDALGDTFIGIENLTGSAYTDTLRGDDTPNALNGANGNDKLYGLNGDDVLAGGRGRDYLDGGVGIDWLYGGEGKDTICGGVWGDVLSGGEGNDTFVYKYTHESPFDAHDLIVDFERGIDEIDLKLIDADVNKAGHQAFSFIGEAGLSGQARQLNFVSGLLSGDIDGDGFADIQIKLYGVKLLSTSDLIL